MSAPFETRSGLEKHIRLLQEELAEKVRTCDFQRARAIQESLDRMEVLREALPDLETLKSMAFVSRKDMEQAVLMRDFSSASQLQTELESLTARINQEETDLAAQSVKSESARVPRGNGDDSSSVGEERSFLYAELQQLKEDLQAACESDNIERPRMIDATLRIFECQILKKLSSIDKISCDLCLLIDELNQAKSTKSSDTVGELCQRKESLEDRKKVEQYSEDEALENTDATSRVSPSNDALLKSEERDSAANSSVEMPSLLSNIPDILPTLDEGQGTTSSSVVGVAGGSTTDENDESNRQLPLESTETVGQDVDRRSELSTQGTERISNASAPVGAFAIQQQRVTRRPRGYDSGPSLDELSQSSLSCSSRESGFMASTKREDQGGRFVFPIVAEVVQPALDLEARVAALEAQHQIHDLCFQARNTLPTTKSPTKDSTSKLDKEAAVATVTPSPPVENEPVRTTPKTTAKTAPPVSTAAAPKVHKRYCKEHGLCIRCGKVQTHRRKRNRWRAHMEPLTKTSKHGVFIVYMGYHISPSCFTLEEARKGARLK